VVGLLRGGDPPKRVTMDPPKEARATNISTIEMQALAIKKGFGSSASKK
jgi:hypothetical protein